MKPFLMSWLLVLGLAVVAETSPAANMRYDRQANSPQQQQQAGPSTQNAPTPNQQTPVFRPDQHFEQNRPVPNVRLKLSGTLNVPSGVLTPPGVVGTLSRENHTPRQNFVGGQRDFRIHHGGVGSGNFHRERGGGDFHHRRSNFIIVYVNGAPCWYPVYTAYPYYYDAPLAPSYDSGDSSATTYVPSVEDDGSEAPSSYADVGREWGQDLRREVATWDQFVDYLRSYIVGAPPAAQADFREAFIASYGINGAAAYDKAAQQAVGPSAPTPKVITLQPGS
ncbi:MAG TPA: hypothetical protein VL171_08195 [Verrucomicrobiae bacterium]|nr:hypothetical protein [Verrucomicrobiae bacterium]